MRTTVDKFVAAQREDVLRTELLRVRDELQQIVDGEIERGHCLPGKREAYLDKPGKRAIRLDDARKMARHLVAAINRTITQLDE
jgi:hypothetical protein